MKAKTLVVAVLWLALAGGLFYFFNAKLNPNTAEKLGEAAEVVLERDPSGHYRAEAFINGVKTPVMVDTGATDVVLSQALANSLGLRSTDAIRIQTANGDAVSYMIRLESVKLGGVEARNVAAAIAPGMDGEALLGMSFLGRMDVRLYKGTMTVRSAE